jgi:hypothetical protein
MTVKAKIIPYAGREERSTSRGGPRTPRKQLGRNNRFTADIIEGVMLDVVKTRLKMPTKEALEKLASILESWRGQYWRSQHIDPLENEVALRADELFSTLKKLREMYRVQTGERVGSYLARKIEAIDHACGALIQLSNESIAIEHSGDLTWHWLANVLPVDFATAIQTTNQGYKIGIGHTGPLVRFIHAVVPLLTGEHPTEGTVALQLKNFRTKFLPGKQFGDRIPPPASSPMGNK